MRTKEILSVAGLLGNPLYIIQCVWSLTVDPAFIFGQFKGQRKHLLDSNVAAVVME